MNSFVLLITALFILGGNAGGNGGRRQDYIIEGTDNLDETDVNHYEFNFGSNWRGPEQSEVCMEFVSEVQLGEPRETFFFIPPGETSPLEITFQTIPSTFIAPFTFETQSPPTDDRVCGRVVKLIPDNTICIVEGTSACNGRYRYLVTEGDNYDEAFSKIEFIGGLAPRFIVSEVVNTPTANTFTGRLGATFQVGTNGADTVSILATDNQGEPLGNIEWRFIAQGSTSEIVLPGSLVGVTVNGVVGESTLQISGITTVHLGEYIAVATNEHGEARDSATIISAPFITEGSGVSSSNSFRVGANRAANLGETITIRAEDQISDLSSTITWSYFRSESGPYSAISSGGSYQISSSSGVVGTDSSLRISNIQPDQFGYYRAEAVNQFGTHTSTASLIGTQPVFQTGSGQIGDTYLLSAGESLSITAQFSDGFPVGEITWRGPNGPISPTTPGYTIAQGLGSSILVINSARVGTDYGQYTASGSNVFGQVTSTSSVNPTQIIVPPNIDEGSSTTVNTDGTGRIGELFQVSFGQTVTIRANEITGIEASSFRWSKMGPDQTEYEDITKNPQYAISTVQNPSCLSDSLLTFVVGANTYGTYRAEATNSAGTNAAISQVGQPPRVGRLSIITIEGSKTTVLAGDLYIPEGGSVTLTAVDTEGEPEREFYWAYRNDPSIRFQLISSSSIHVEGKVGSLILNNIDRSQYGEYWGIAINQFGYSSVTTIVGAPPIIRFSTGTETDGYGEIGDNFIIPLDRRLRITACVIGGYPPADPDDFRFLEKGVELDHVQLPTPYDNCFIYEEGEFEIACRTTITARTRNIFGFSNQPSSEITFPVPFIVAESSTCSEGNTVTSAQIGSDLCLYGSNSFAISCSIERTNIPRFRFEWEFNGNPITDGGLYNIDIIRESEDISVLSVSDVTVDDMGRYTCRVVSRCDYAESELAESSRSTDVSHYDYEYKEEVGRIQCFQSLNGGTQEPVDNSVCDRLGLSRPQCSDCDWIIGPWSDCSDITCHRGRRFRDVLCVCDRMVQEDKECISTPKPEVMDRCGPVGIRCNRPFEWKSNSFSQCSATCGDSFKSRSVECISSITGEVVSEVECSLLCKPENEIQCDVPVCDCLIDQTCQTS